MIGRLRMTLTLLSAVGFMHASASAVLIGAGLSLGRISLVGIGALFGVSALLATGASRRLSVKCLEFALDDLKRDARSLELTQVAVHLLEREGRQSEADQVLLAHVVSENNGHGDNGRDAN